MSTADLAQWLGTHFAFSSVITVHLAKVTPVDITSRQQEMTHMLR